MGRSLRKEDLPYDAYLKVISIVRERAGKEKIPLEKAAKKIVQSSLEV